MGLKLANGERELWRCHETLAVGRQDVNVNAIGHIDAAGVLSQALRRYVQYWILEIGIVVLAFALELPHVESEHDTHRLDAGKALFDDLAMPLHRCTECPQVQGLGPDAAPPAAPAGAERQNLAEAI